MSFVSSASSSTAYQPLLSFQGLESGLNTSSIISALMQAYSAPLDDLEAQQKAQQTQISAYQAISSDLSSLHTAAEALSAPGALADSLSAASSNPSVATATVGAGAAAGSTTFVVDQLAQAGSYVSSGTVASANDVVAASTLMLGVGGAALGVTSLSAGSGLAAGSHTITVAQASTGATVTGTSAPATSTTIDSSNNTLSVSLDGGATATYTLASGTYTAAQLAAAVGAASGATLTAEVDSSGHLAVATSEQGSAATLSITGGTALGALGLPTTSAAATGTDAVVDVDGTATTVTDLAGSGTTTLHLASGTGGTVTLGVTGGLSAGTMQAVLVSTQGGSLSGVVQAVDGAGLGVTASAVQVASGGYALELSSQATGTAGAVTVDPAAFAASPLGNLQSATVAQDAIVSVGGAGGPEVRSSTNTVTGLLPGVSVQLAAAGPSPVTVSVNPDGSVVAPKVKALVDAANQVLGDMATDTAYNAATNTAGPLNGQYGLTGLAQQVLSSVGEALGVSSLGAQASAAGIGLTSKGTLTFDSTAFATAYDAHPSQVAALLTQGGTWAAASAGYGGQVSLVTGTDTTRPGSYTVAISQAATQAIDTGSAGFASASSTLGAAGSYTVSEGSAAATYAFRAGDTVSQTVAGLDAAFAQAGMDLSAEETTNASGQSAVSIVSSQYGSAERFSVAASGADALGLASSSPFAGTDVAGTIDGITATGTGQILAAPVTDPTLGGLALQVTTPSVSGTTTLGTFTYAPGMAQTLASLASAATTGPGGLISSSIAGLQADSSSLSSQISLEQQVVNQEQAMLTQEFNHLEASLAKIKSQGSALNAALGASTTTTTTQGG